jgi:hypothetical protein
VVPTSSAKPTLAGTLELALLVNSIMSVTGVSITTVAAPLFVTVRSGAEAETDTVQRGMDCHALLDFL